MVNDLKPVILAALGDPPPREAAAREAVYERIRSELATILTGEDAAAEQSRLALQQAVDTIEAELSAAEQAPTAAEQAPDPAAPAPLHMGKVAAAVVAVVAIAAAGIWYFVWPREPTTAPVAPQTTRSQQDRPPISDKAKSFQDALRNADAATAAFLIQSGYRPTRVELREALLTAQFTPNIKAATAPLGEDIRDIACTFASYPDVRKPMARSGLFDAEDAFAVMKQIGQEQWTAICSADREKWREALKKIEAQYAQYSKPDAEKKDQALACIKRFSEPQANERWEQVNCGACPEGHSSCETYCPQAPKAADAEEARFFRFNRSDMLMAGIASRRANAGRAELFCNMQYLTRATDFDLANLQRFKALVSLFE